MVPSLSHVTTHFVHLDRIAVRLDRLNNILNMSTVHSVHHIQYPPPSLISYLIPQEFSLSVPRISYSLPKP
jgi:hypothetical protein